MKAVVRRAKRKRSNYHLNGPMYVTVKMKFEGNDKWYYISTMLDDISGINQWWHNFASYVESTDHISRGPVVSSIIPIDDNINTHISIVRDLISHNDMVSNPENISDTDIRKALNGEFDRIVSDDTAEKLFLIISSYPERFKYTPKDNRAYIKLTPTSFKTGGGFESIDGDTFVVIDVYDGKVKIYPDDDDYSFFGGIVHNNLDLLDYIHKILLLEHKNISSPNNVTFYIDKRAKIEHTAESVVNILRCFPGEVDTASIMDEEYLDEIDGRMCCDTTHHEDIAWAISKFNDIFKCSPSDFIDCNDISLENEDENICIDDIANRIHASDTHTFKITIYFKNGVKYDSVMFVNVMKSTMVSAWNAYCNDNGICNTNCIKGFSVQLTDTDDEYVHNMRNHLRSTIIFIYKSRLKYRTDDLDYLKPISISDEHMEAIDNMIRDFINEDNPAYYVSLPRIRTEKRSDGEHIHIEG